MNITYEIKGRHVVFKETTDDRVWVWYFSDFLDKSIVNYKKTLLTCGHLTQRDLHIAWLVCRDELIERGLIDEKLFACHVCAQDKWSCKNSGKLVCFLCRAKMKY